jgi:hypothetical protein
VTAHERAPEPDHDHVHLPAPSLWPVLCGAGVALIAFGMLTHPAFAVAGLLAMARALHGWIEEMRHE